MLHKQRSIDVTQVMEWRDGKVRRAQDYLVAEEPLEIRLGETPLSVTMRTPGHDLELAAGFLFTEGLIKRREQIVSLEYGEEKSQQASGNTVQVQLSGTSLEPEQLRRNFFMTSSCGICGKASIEAVKAHGIQRPNSTFSLDPEVLCAFPDTLKAAQSIFDRTGGLHAAGLFDVQGKLIVLREDVGRHNAVDKVVGWTLLGGQFQLPLADYALMVSGRGGFEIIQKALIAGLPLVASVSAPSSLAVRLARETGLTLVGFLRGRRFLVYSGEERLGLKSVPPPSVGSTEPVVTQNDNRDRTSAAKEMTMASEQLPNRWGIAVAAVVMQICLGAVYGWSVFKIPLMHTEHWSETQVQLNFTLAIFFLGVGTIVGGLWQDRKGPRLVASVAGVVYGIGYILAGVFTNNHNLNGLYFAYGILTGLGMGMGYICPVATLVKWFPERRGLMTGVAVCGYGAGALVMSPIAARLIIAHNVPYTFVALGIVYLILVIAAAQFYANPPFGWKPAGWVPSSAVAKAATTYDYTVKEAMSTWQLWLLWAMLFLNVSAGIMIISQASPMAQQMVGMTAIAAASMVGLISIFNGLGRVFWAWVSDHLGRARVYFLLFLIQVVIFFSLPRIHNLTLFSIAFAIIGLCYGGGFGTMPSFTADFFGARYMGGIYGIILLAWGAAAIPSPIMIARLHQATGRFDTSIYVIALVMAVSLILPLVARRPKQKEEARMPMAHAA